jgi:hypothetical protein
MDSEVFERTRSAELATAMQSYQTVKDGYTRLVRVALQQDDPVRRSESLQTIMNENARLTKVVEGLLQMWSTGKEDLSSYSKYKISSLREELEQYKRQLDELKNSKDELTRLQLLHASLQTETSSERTTYLMYITIVLVLLILVFVMFVYSSFSATSSFSVPLPEVVTDSDF